MKKFSFAALMLIAVLMPAQAETIANALSQCKAEQNSLKRLVCYDRVAQSIDRYSGLEDLVNVPAPLPARAASSVNRAAQESVRNVPQSTASGADADFGMENQVPTERKDKIYAEIANIDKGPRKRYIITLSNGHVWKQTDGESLRLKVGQTVYIERGALGAFYLSKESANKRIRVKRAK